MKIIYIDSEYCCHTSNPDGIFYEVYTDYFDGKCQTYIEGYRLIPSGEKWIREDGQQFFGEMIAPWKDYDELNNAQYLYERQQLIEYNEILSELGVEI